MTDSKAKREATLEALAAIELEMAAQPELELTPAAATPEDFAYLPEGELKAESAGHLIQMLRTKRTLDRANLSESLSGNRLLYLRRSLLIMEACRWWLWQTIHHRCHKEGLILTLNLPSTKGSTLFAMAGPIMSVQDESAGLTTTIDMTALGYLYQNWIAGLELASHITTSRLMMMQTTKDYLKFLNGLPTKYACFYNGANTLLHFDSILDHGDVIIDIRSDANAWKFLYGSNADSWSDYLAGLQSSSPIIRLNSMIFAAMYLDDTIHFIRTASERTKGKRREALLGIKPNQTAIYYILDGMRTRFTPLLQNAVLQSRKIHSYSMTEIQSL